VKLGTHQWSDGGQRLPVQINDGGRKKKYPDHHPAPALGVEIIGIQS
jgi:hypothetical protein